MLNARGGCCYRVLTGTVDDRVIQKYEREAKEKNRESWYLAYVMDTNEEERAKVCVLQWCWCWQRVFCTAMYICEIVCDHVCLVACVIVCVQGKTVEVGRAHFATAAKRYTILDAPGHKNYVPNMVVGAAQADIGVLIISARKGEFETGFEKGGQTREHAM